MRQTLYYTQLPVLVEVPSAIYSATRQDVVAWHTLNGGLEL
ncbi:MAG: hypothetical protein RIE73_34310 [Coleofasciculus sp. C1-SOL-03]